MMSSLYMSDTCSSGYVESLKATESTCMTTLPTLPAAVLFVGPRKMA